MVDRLNITYGNICNYIDFKGITMDVSFVFITWTYERAHQVTFIFGVVFITFLPYCFIFIHRHEHEEAAAVTSLDADIKLYRPE